MARVKRDLKLRVTREQVHRWQSHADTYRRGDLSAFVAFAADWVCRYLRELDRTRDQGHKPDQILQRIEARQKFQKLLTLAKQVEPFVPKRCHSPIQGDLGNLGRELRETARAIEEEHLDGVWEVLS